MTRSSEELEPYTAKLGQWLDSQGLTPKEAFLVCTRFNIAFLVTVSIDEEELDGFLEAFRKEAHNAYKFVQGEIKQ